MHTDLIPEKGVPQLGRYTLEDIKQHRTQEDAWTAIQGKVYNITPYLKFHPGGVKDLMRCAGRDGTKLFSKFLLKRKRKEGLTNICSDDTFLGKHGLSFRQVLGWVFSSLKLRTSFFTYTHVYIYS